MISTTGLNILTFTFQGLCHFLYNLHTLFFWFGDLFFKFCDMGLFFIKNVNTLAQKT